MPDVIVLGSGAAGLAAALGAVQQGASVTLLERAGAFGGTTALSGGAAWLPGNRFTGPDDTSQARTYMRQLDLGDTSPEMIDVFVADSGRVASAIEDATPFTWFPINFPDYHSDFLGGAQTARAIQPEAFETDRTLVKMVRLGREGAAPVRPGAEREIPGPTTLSEGPALVGGLLRACLDAGVDVRSGVRARRLIVEGGEVVGVEADGEMRGRVVLATGGFDRDPGLVKTFLRGPMVAPMGVTELTGDGLRMAMAVGARLGSMSEAHWGPAIRIPGDTLDGAPMHRLLLAERASPGSLIVDRTGRRFANEAQNYNDLGRTLHGFDASAFDFIRVPAWIVFDARFRREYAFGPLRPHDPDPGWLMRGDDLAALAGRIGVPADRLADTIDRFNAMAEAGEDDDYGRGDGFPDRFMGDATRPHPTLGPILEPPFYAAEVLPGCLGTKGGPRTDADGRVLAVEEGVIPGLYAAGNAAASPFGLAYPGAGGTIGPALVFGLRAGEAAAVD